MQILDFDTTFQQIISKILSHFLGQRSHQRAFVTCHTILDFSKQIIDLPVNRAHIDLRIDQSCRSNNLFDHTVTQAKLIIARSGGKVDRLADALKEFRPFERSVVHRRRQTEAMFDQRAFATGIAFIHGADLRHGNMRFVNDE